MSNAKIATVYSKDGCGFCVKAKHVLLDQGYEIDERKIGENGVTKESMFEDIGREVRTVPQIMIGGKYVGGYQEVREFLGL